MRKFECPHCAYVHIFAPTGKSKHKKRFSGYTCPNCHKKVTDQDILRRKGEGPKPKGERRKRVKREEPVWAVPLRGGEGPPRPIYEQIEWKTRDPLPPGQSHNPGHRNYRGWSLRRSLQPTDRTLGEASMSSLGIRPSAPIPYANYVEVNGELEKLKEERQALEGIREEMDTQKKKLAMMIVRLDRVEERLNAQVDKLCESLEQLDPKIQAFSTLVSHMVSAEPNRRQPR